MKVMKQAALVLCFVLGAGLSGCVSVNPWERGNLAKPQMALDPHPMQSSFRSHQYISREASSGGGSAGGGGCGCY
ncbi:DUF4266 domain-containing protein [Methylocaldum sp. MU1018]|jgi:hypothetical protein